MDSPPLTDLLDVRVPILQGGMTWVSRHELAAAVTAAGGLGVIGSGGMEPAELRDEIRALRALTEGPYGVNIPLINVRADDKSGIVDQLIAVTIEEHVPIVVTGAGSARRHTKDLQAAGATVIHVVPSVALARKARDAGVDAVVAESSDSGGHVRSSGLSTFALLPQVVDALDIPVIAAGGIADARGIVAALALGASGVQLGTRFVATAECNAHAAFKTALLEAGPEGAAIYSRDYHASRGLTSPAVRTLIEMEQDGCAIEDLIVFRGRRRAYRGCIEGDIEHGILPAGSAVGLVHELQTVAELMNELVRGAGTILARLGATSLPNWLVQDRDAA